MVVWVKLLKNRLYSLTVLEQVALQQNIIKRWVTIVGAFVTWRILYTPHACGALRKRRCARARFTQLRALAAPVGGVRDARCASLLVCAWLQSPRTPVAIALPIQERFSPAFRLAFLFLLFRTKLCRFWPLLLCTCLRLGFAFHSLRPTSTLYSYFVKMSSMVKICNDFYGRRNRESALNEIEKWTKLSFDCTSNRNHCKFTADFKH